MSTTQRNAYEIEHQGKRDGTTAPLMIERSSLPAINACRDTITLEEEEEEREEGRNGKHE